MSHPGQDEKYHSTKLIIIMELFSRNLRIFQTNSFWIISIFQQNITKSISNQKEDIILDVKKAFDSVL